MRRPAFPPEGLAQDERWLLVERVAASALFQKSPKLRDFLLFVCGNYLGGQLDAIREQQIGVSVFGRRPDYNVSEDSIVRVEARELRRRLAAYFENEGRNEPFTITMPKGGYAPVFAPRAAAAEASALEPVETAADEPGTALEKRRRPSPVRMAALASALFAAGWLANSAVSALWRPAAEPPQRAPAALAFYFDLLGPLASDSQAQTSMALSNPRVMLYWGHHSPNAPGEAEGRTVRIPSVADNVLLPAANVGDRESPYHFVRITETMYTGMGEGIGAFHVGQLLANLKRPVNLTQNRFLNWESARKEHLILLGAPAINEWPRMNVRGGDLRLIHKKGILNTRPLPGEQPMYSEVEDPQTGNVVLDHGLISMTAMPAHSRVLVLAGQSSPGTGAAAEFFANPAKMRPVYEKIKAELKGKPFPESWQVLIRIAIRDMVVVETRYLTHRVLSPAE